MKPKGALYTVVENAGYDGERDRRSFPSPEDAWRWATRYYGKNGLEHLHVAVRRDCGDEKTYEF